MRKKPVGIENMSNTWNGTRGAFPGTAGHLELRVFRGWGERRTIPRGPGGQDWPSRMF